MHIRSNTFLVTLMTLSMIVLVQCNSSSEPEEKEWEIVWQDEFDGPEGQSPDPANWAYDTWGNESGWGNNQLEYDTDRPENVSLDGEGHLAIVARKEAYLGKSYTSARITTQDLFETAYGRFEARMKMPWGQGLWPAFWLLGDNFDTIGWPHCGEIDIMEYRGQEPSIIHGTLHGPGYSGGQGVGSSFALSNARFDTDFHTFSVEWDLEGISWFVDGELYQTLDSTDVNGDWVYDHPFFIILNLAVGGGYVGAPDADTVFPQTLLIDYVRVYKEVQ